MDVTAMDVTAMDVAAIVAEADRLQYSNRWREACDYLELYSEKTTEPEILWRLIRSYYFTGKHLAKEQKEKEHAAEKGLEMSERALVTIEGQTSCSVFLVR